jgi:hypothetical protein
MNERIKQLAVEANLISAEYNGFDRTSLNPAEKKFAELIVQYCANILRTEADSNWEGREERLLKAMANWIEQCCGIDE